MEIKRLSIGKMVFIWGWAGFITCLALTFGNNGTTEKTSPLKTFVIANLSGLCWLVMFVLLIEVVLWLDRRHRRKRSEKNRRNDDQSDGPHDKS